MFGRVQFVLEMKLMLLEVSEDFYLPDSVSLSALEIRHDCQKKLSCCTPISCALRLHCFSLLFEGKNMVNIYIIYILLIK